MAKEKFGVAVDKEIVQEVDELVAECDDLGAAGSEIVEAILTAFAQSESNHAERVRKVIIRKQKGYSLTDSKPRALGARNSKQIIRYNSKQTDCSA